MPTNIDTNALNRRFPVPDGFRSLLEALAREVLRGQPSDIYAFSALFFDKLLEIRKEYDGLNPVQEPELYEKFKIQLFTEASKRRLVSPKLTLSMGLPLDDAKYIPTYRERTRSDQDELEEVAEKRGENGVNRRISAVDNEEEQVDEPLSDEQDFFEKEAQAEERAATKIQAEIRGFLTRKNYQRNKNARNSVQIETSADQRGILKQSHSVDALGDLDFDDDTMMAATKIQAGIRGYLTRQRYNEMKKEQRQAAAKIQAGVRGHLTRKKLEAEGVPIRRRSRSPSPMIRPSAPEFEPEPQSTVSDGDEANDEFAAAKIQAGVRGYLTRKRLGQRGVPVKAPRRQSLPHHLSTPSDMRQRSGTNPDEQAATKIQAGIRGYLTRKRLKETGSSSNIADTGAIRSPDDIETEIGADNEYDGDGDADDEQNDILNVNPEMAATKIQAGVRSYLTRVNMKKQKEAATKIQSAFRGHQVRRDYKGPSRNIGSADDENGWENVPSDGEV